MHRVVGRAALLSLALALVASPAGAQEHNPQFLPLGERAMGLGGAYSAHGGDASAVYYGAAGLVFSRRVSVQASLSLRLFERYAIAGATPDESFDLEYGDGIGLPVYVGGAFRFGEDMEDGAGRHSLAVATFSPIRHRRHFVLHEDRGAGDGVGFSVRRDDVVRWYGLAYAARVVEELGIGLSLFLSTRKFVHEESELFGMGGTAISARNSIARLNAEALILRLSAHLEIDPTFAVGLTVQLPGWEIGGRGSVGAASGVAGPGGVTTFFDSRDEVPVRSPVPWQIRAGVAWRPNDDWVITADAAFVGPIGSDTDPITRFDLGGTDAATFGHYLENQFWGEPVIDGAIGARVQIVDVSLSAGVFTNLSSAPTISDVLTTSYRPDRTEVVGATLAFSYRRDDVDISAGLVGTLGFGRGLRPIDGGAAGLQYEPVGVESQSLHLFITGAGRVGSLLRELTTEIVREAEREREEVIEEAAEDEAEDAATEEEAAEEEAPIEPADEPADDAAPVEPVEPDPEDSTSS